MSHDLNRMETNFLGAVFQSLARPVEMSFKNGTTAFGIFSGLDPQSRQLLIVNFCFAGENSVQQNRKVDLGDLHWFVVRDPPNTRQAAGRAKPAGSKNASQGLTRAAAGNGSLENGDTKSPLQKDGKGDRPRGIKNEEFRTDVEISKKTTDPKKSGSGKVFKRVSVELSGPGELLEHTGKIGEFDQFRANKDAFGITSHFNENDYTTYLDISKASPGDIERAEKLAREIEGSSLGNFVSSRHMQEERGLTALKDNDEDDEEALYSAVVREDAPAPPAVKKPDVKIESKSEQKEPLKKDVKTEQKKKIFGLRKVPPEKLPGIRVLVESSTLAAKPTLKETPVVVAQKPTLATQLAPAPPATIQPLPEYQFQGQPTQPMMMQPMYYQMGYPQQFAYYPQGLYYQSGFTTPGMYGQQPYYQQPK